MGNLRMESDNMILSKVDRDLMEVITRQLEIEGHEVSDLESYAEEHNIRNVISGNSRVHCSDSERNPVGMDEYEEMLEDTGFGCSCISRRTLEMKKEYERLNYCGEPTELNWI